MSEIPIYEPRWRMPKQARSRERFDRILDAGAELFAARGYESVTTDDIAAQADTSVGGLYRFFPDKLAVFQALVSRYLDQLRQLFDALHSEEAFQLTLEEYVGQVVDGFDQFVSANPAFRAVFVQSRLVSTETLAMDTAFNQEIAQQLSAFLGARHPWLEAEQRDLLAAVCVEVASALEILSLTRDRTFQQQVLGETKKLLIAYLKQYFPD
ncbi:TetR/AcrR family transcriptional regulator [Pseudanabaena sp. FACHB-2040]|uniref:TetR/AcrR family transcriptional regulator n=1 Tax=Pseudanabaena sp. FACHB-2040 TaxID=2692859 RepID=UPI001682C706|nr:TetR/AcrR family transcriptional regulator [Pseudanabaena sp. FACHB-2040]MBD2258211.1 TetR family transcriptional regulator [Pseudanabaena sp. FACHB-2040]